jgi:hypothetical protein
MDRYQVLDRIWWVLVGIGTKERVPLLVIIIFPKRRKKVHHM